MMTGQPQPRHKRVRGLAAAVATMALLATGACSPGRNLPPLPDAKVQGYRLGAGDQVRVITFGEDQLTGDFRVSDSGTIEMPLLGAVRAGGMTPSQLGGEISRELVRRNLFRSPSVAVEVSEYRPIFILGEVSKPGQYPYRPGMTVLSAVSVAGGFTYRAVDDRASVIRTEGNKAVEARADRQALLEPGDVVTIYERLF